MPTTHQIKFSLVNEKKLPVNISVSINEQALNECTLSDSCDDYTIDFVFEYSQPEKINTLTIQFSGEEQQNKQLTIKNIIINDCHLSVYSGFYEVKHNKWWQDLSSEEYRTTRRKVLEHGGQLGWFGSISYEFINSIDALSTNKIDPCKFGVSKIKL